MPSLPRKGEAIKLWLDLIQSVGNHSQAGWCSYNLLANRGGCYGREQCVQSQCEQYATGQVQGHGHGQRWAAWADNERWCLCFAKTTLGRGARTGFGQQLPDSWGSARSRVSGSDPNILLCDSSWHSQGFVEVSVFWAWKRVSQKG